MRGRKPKPPSVRALHKSDSRAARRDRREGSNQEGDQVDHRSIPDPPRELVKTEQRYWRYFAPLLAGARVLTPADVQSFADYCRACVAVDDRGRRLRAALAKRTLDQSLVRLLDNQMRGWIEKKTRLASELGLTAISRTRINWTGYSPQKPTSEAAADQPKSRFAQLQERAAILRRPLGVT
jgi:phage terminase small subunit